MVSDTVIIFTHGFAEGPAVFYGLVKACESAGYATDVITLPGHGGTCRDFATTKGDRWLEHLQQAISRDAEKFDNIVLVGHSLGAILSIICANLSQKVRGVVLLNAPLAVRVSPRAVAVNLTIGMGLDIKPGDRAWSASQAMSVSRGYPWEYIGWIPRVMDLFRLTKIAKKVLPQLEVPILAFHSNNDELIGRKGLQLLNQLSPKSHSKVIELHHSSHYGFSGGDESIVTQSLLEFVEAVR